MNTKGGTLRVPGRSLYYKVRGSGPLLLILQGGAGDADGSESLVGRLVDRYTVVTYDRRGLSRSTVDDQTAALSLEAHGDDAHELLSALTKSPALVFGSSIGALIGLELTARHADQVGTLVAHEPPARELLPDQERTSVGHAQEDVEETYRREGVAAAMQRFAVMAGLNFADREPEVELPGPADPRAPAKPANLAFFLTHDAPAVRRYRLDIAALRAAPTRIVLGAGSNSSETWPHRCAAALAERLDRELVRFPGGHTGYVMHPRGFAVRLREVLDNLPQAAGV